MSGLSVSKAEWWHLEQALLDVSEENEAQAWAVARVDAARQATKVWEKADLDYCFSAFHEHKVMVVAGVTPLPNAPGVATTWALFTEEAKRHPVAVGLWSKSVFDTFFERYKRLETLILASYTRNVRWHRWLGWQVREAALLPPYMAACHHCTMERPI